MTTMKKIFSMIALLLMAVTGAMTQTYNVTVKDGTEDAANWSADPNPATAGQTVTIKYNGTKKVKSIKAVKKKAAAAARTLAEATAEDVGKTVGADGNIYDTKADAEAVATGNAVAMIAYVGSGTDNATYQHGLAIALSDEGEMFWSTAKSTCEGKTAVSGAAWLLPSQDQWKAMFKANGGSESSYSGLNSALATAGGNSSELLGSYWSSTETGGSTAYFVRIFGDTANFMSDGKASDYGVRACLAF